MHEGAWMMWTRVEVAVWLFIYICSSLNERRKLGFVILYSMLSDLSTFRSCFLKGIKIWVGPLCRLHTLSCHSMSGRNDILFQKACIRWIMFISGIYGYDSTDRCKLFLPQYLISFAFTLNSSLLAAVSGRLMLDFEPRRISTWEINSRMSAGACCQSQPEYMISSMPSEPIFVEAAVQVLREQNYD